mgnify:CR=1 FL=1
MGTRTRAGVPGWQPLRAIASQDLPLTTHGIILRGSERTGP